MSSPRPPLPAAFNPNVLSIVHSGSFPAIKYQILTCQGTDILVARMKIDTPASTGHAFILRRYDTGALSATTMYRAAFPFASDEEEKEELQWVKENYDLSGNNGSSRDTQIPRLAGTWVSPTIATELGAHYKVGPLVVAMIAATPNPNGNYRRSNKNSTPASKVADSPMKPVSFEKPVSTTSDSWPPPKRRRAAATPEPKPSPSPARSPPPRRSLRATKSPSLKSEAKPARTPRRTTRREQVDTPGGSDQTAVDEDVEGLENAMESDLHSQDIAEQKEMIEDLKREAALKAEHDDIDMESKAKRSRDDDEPLRFQPKPKETESRVIATNRRVGRFHLEPKGKSVAWGVAAFVFGAGAVTLLPNFF